MEQHSGKFKLNFVNSYHQDDDFGKTSLLGRFYTDSLHMGIFCTTYYHMVGAFTGYYINPQAFPDAKLKIGEEEKTLYFRGYINSRPYWSGGNYIVHYTYSYDWVIVENEPIFMGYEPIEYEVIDEDETWRNGRITYKYEGDTFWTGWFDGTGDVTSGVFRPKNVAHSRGYGNVTVTLYKPAFKYVGEGIDPGCGEYQKNNDTNVSTSLEKIVIGLPQWWSGSTPYTRSLEKTGGNYTYGNIHYADGKWLIGTEGDDDGWWEGDEPVPGKNFTFYFTKNRGSSATGEDIFCEWYGYVNGDNYTDVYVAQMAIWR